MDGNSDWCDGNAARVDEIKPGVTKEQLKFLAVKSVCKNGTALPVLYSPVDQSSWGPPYSLGRKMC